MQSPARIAVSLFLLLSVFTSAYQTSAKLRRDGVLNLYPFPRVGRASHSTWEVPLNDYLENRPSEKRQLYAFPRVGRSDMPLFRDLVRSEQLQLPLRLEELLFGRPRSRYMKRESEKEIGMWFGPRVGRSFKEQSNKEDDVSTPNTGNSGHSEPELLEEDHIEDRIKRQIKAE